MAATGQGRTNVRVRVTGGGEANVETGLAVLDHLLSLLAANASFDLSLEVEPGTANAEIAAAGRALGEALAEPLRRDGVRGHGSAVVPADEALAHVVLEAFKNGTKKGLNRKHASESTEAHHFPPRVAGQATDVVARFLGELAEGAGLTVHVRLIEGSDTQHVLEAIFKALGVALAQATRPRR